MGLIKQSLAGVREENQNIIAVPDVLGIQSMSTSEYVIRIVAQCAPNTRGEVERAILEHIKQALEAEEQQKQALSEMAASEE